MRVRCTQVQKYDLEFDILLWYFRPFLVSVGRRRLGVLLRALVRKGAGVVCSLDFRFHLPLRPRVPLLSLAGAWSCWCVLPWALWVSRPLFSLSSPEFLVALYSRFLSEVRLAARCPGRGVLRLLALVFVCFRTVFLGLRREEFFHDRARVHVFP